MRIIGEIPHPSFKITVFQMNARISVKIEFQLLEQTYKFRDGSGVQNLADAERFLTPDFLRECQTIFTQMEKSKLTSLMEMNQDGEEFDEII